MYKATQGTSIFRVSDCATIPVDPGNRDYQDYLAWVAKGNVADPADVPIVPRRLVPKSTIIDRLNAAGKLVAASAALNANLYTRERWYAPDRPAVYADDPEVLALLAAIGADPAVVLAP
jgi:hypothetical protein